VTFAPETPPRANSACGLRGWPRSGGLYVLVSSREGGGPAALDELVEACGRGGARAIQLRDKGEPPGRLLERARRLRTLTRRWEMALVINDSPEIARECGADGVHVGAGDAPIQRIRREHGDALLVGATCHGAREARRAEEAGADYLGVGTVFPSRTKPSLPARGPEIVRAVLDAVRIPCFAVGGIDPGNVDRVAATGVAGVAVSRAVIAAPDPEGAVRRLVSALGDRGRSR